MVTVFGIYIAVVLDGKGQYQYTSLWCYMGPKPTTKEVAPQLLIYD